MSKVNYAKQIYVAFALSVPTVSLVIEGYRSENFFTKFYFKKVNKELTPKLADLIENEIDSFLIEHKSFSIRDIEFKVSLYDNFTPKTWGSFLLKEGSEIQFPVTFNIQDYDEFREYIKNKFLSLKDTPIPYKFISDCFLSDEGKKFCIKRELFKANNGYHLFFPSFLWIFSSSIFYLTVSFLFPVTGIPIGCLTAALGTIGIYPTLLKKYKEKEEKYFDKIVIDSDELYKKGADDFFNYCRSLKKLVGIENFGKSDFDLIEKRMHHIKKKAIESRLMNRKNFIEKKNNTQL